MILKKPFKVEVLYKKSSSEEESYSSLLEQLNILPVDDLPSKFATIYCVDSIMPQSETSDRCSLNTYTDSFVTVKSYEEIEKELEKYS